MILTAGLMTNQTLGILKNKIIISALLLFVSACLYSQILPLDIAAASTRGIIGLPRIQSVEFGSGFIIRYFDREPQYVEISSICVITDDHSFLFNKGEILYQKGDYDEAVEIFKKMISDPITYNDTASWTGEGYKIVQLKSKACDYLKQISFSKKKYNEALVYHTLQNTSFRNISSGCFWGVMEQRFVQDRFAISCHEALGNYDEAIKLIYWYWGFKNYNSETILAELLKKKYGDKALKEIIIDIINYGKINFEGRRFSINISGLDLSVSYYKYKYKELKESGNDNIAIRREKIEPTEQEIKEERMKALENFKNSIFYKLIMEN
jgi:tetratricopeptide (TPR) repeat protein